MVAELSVATVGDEIQLILHVRLSRSVAALPIWWPLKSNTSTAMVQLEALHHDHDLDQLPLPVLLPLPLSLLALLLLCCVVVDRLLLACKQTQFYFWGRIQCPAPTPSHRA